MSAESRLSAEAVTLAYEHRTVSRDVTLRIPDRGFTVVVGPNACGKSTMLRALARLLRPQAGEVLLDGKALHTVRPRDAARQIGLLPQSSTTPDGIVVADLVARGRYAHQGLLRRWSSEDEDAVREAMETTGTAELAERRVDELSGGQRQRVQMATVLAQRTPLLLLDEPTTYLDIAHQIELLDLVARLHRQGTTVVAVLHDLQHAARYADHLVVMSDGDVVATGDPSLVLTAELVERVFGLPCLVIEDPVSGTPLVVPRSEGFRA
ncbi:ABC transporter [Marmoricola endophyticus]|uniref:ABC transporter n=1 Tax=Marmoricola endophyticus TaxID=2040280 RepID=A0A917BI64_9ACTN|nr:ABC transporter ATP-binding protein [Marmoricola endophyticus]GGF46769.1 ABC transporter [Marmoricola endophyticus]